MMEGSNADVVGAVRTPRT